MASAMLSLLDQLNPAYELEYYAEEFIYSTIIITMSKIVSNDSTKMILIKKVARVRSAQDIVKILLLP